MRKLLQRIVYPDDTDIRAKSMVADNSNGYNNRDFYSSFRLVFTLTTIKHNIPLHPLPHLLLEFGETALNSRRPGLDSARIAHCARCTRLLNPPLRGASEKRTRIIGIAKLIANRLAFIYSENGVAGANVSVITVMATRGNDCTEDSEKSCDSGKTKNKHFERLSLRRDFLEGKRRMRGNWCLDCFKSRALYT
jgi:hypothetical protein